MFKIYTYKATRTLIHIGNILEKCLATSYKTKHILMHIYEPRACYSIPKYLLKNRKQMFAKRSTYKCSEQLTQNSQKL